MMKKKNNSINEILNLINEAKRPLFICHENPDSDTYGSAFGLRAGLGRLDCDIACVSSVEWPFNELNITGTISDIADVECDLYVFLDCADELRCGTAISDNIKEGIPTINIDHHQSNTYYADYNYMVEKSSTCELIYEFLMEHTGKISKETADYLYTGIAGDTGLFVHGYTTPSAHYTAGKLMEFGADFERISKLLYRTISLGSAMLTGKLYNNLEVIDDVVAISYVSLLDFEKSGAQYEDSESLMHHLTSIDGIKISILLKQKDEKTVKVSFRSTKEYDISKVAIANGGGGHKQAAGCTFYGNISDIKRSILKQIHELGVL